jgi:multimeric flavodoxin WrbA
MGQRHAGRQARWRVHLHVHAARRPGSDAAVDDVALAAPWLRRRRHPYTEPQLNTTRTGGTPYGASHVAGNRDEAQPSDDEAALARALGRRIAMLAARLSP